MGCKQSTPAKTQDKKILIRNTSQINHKFKIVLLGSSSVGKTSIATCYCLGSASKQYGPTIGGVYFKKECKLDSGITITVNIWDTAGQEKHRSMASLYYRDADVIMLVFDLTNAKSFQDLEYWIEQLDYRLQKSDLLVIVVGNKADKKRQVEKNRVQGWLRNYNSFKYMEVSATNGKGVNQIFQLAAESFLNDKKSFQ